ncbi:hypothetical protein GGH92_002932 [Coemansia sp. RSA 2673]|nr:hypothetical protein GGH92_002932 [Coemansia sp. RSA 2673]
MTLVSIFEVLSTLKTLPALVELLCGISGLGPELEDIAIEELPNHVASTYSDNGKNFQVWTTGCHSSRFADRLVDYALLLALASPKLHRIIVVGNTVLDYDAKVSKALESGPYAKYALQLNRMKNAIRE